MVKQDELNKITNLDNLEETLKIIIEKNNENQRHVAVYESKVTASVESLEALIEKNPELGSDIDITRIKDEFYLEEVFNKLLNKFKNDKEKLRIDLEEAGRLLSGENSI